MVWVAAKNAILIVEFAKARHDSGAPVEEAALEGARIRFRPMMTSFAWPYFWRVAAGDRSGAGSAARHALGTSVFGGMIAATVLGVLFVPVYFVMVEALSEWRSKHKKSGQAPQPEAAKG